MTWLIMQLLNYKIKLKSFHLKTLNLAVLHIVYIMFNALKKIKINLLKKNLKKKKKFIVLKAPKINKSARNQFGLITFEAVISSNFLIRNFTLYTLITKYIKKFLIKKLNVNFCFFLIKTSLN